MVPDFVNRFAPGAGNAEDTEGKKSSIPFRFHAYTVIKTGNEQTGVGKLTGLCCFLLVWAWFLVSLLQRILL